MRIQKPSEQPYLPGEKLYAAVGKKESESVRAWLEATEAGNFTPAAPRCASTVMLAREYDDETRSPFHSTKPLDKRVAAPNGIEIFMLRRQRSMKFVPDAVVFPGGRVDARDADPALAWAGPTPAEWANLFDKDEDTARCIVVAAVREVFEESGVLLAGNDAETTLEDVSGPEWHQDRLDLVEHRQSFAEMCLRRNLVIRTDLLTYFANWVTPEFSPQRYDTFFFAARCPKGQKPDDLSREAYIADWVEPQWAFDLGDEGTIQLMPPTVFNLNFALRAQSLDDFMKGPGRPVEKYMSVAAADGNGGYVTTGVLK